MASQVPLKHVVIVGGGFAGVGCAQILARGDKVHVTLIDKHNYHQFQPLFYQLATSQLTPSDVGFSLRKIFRKLPNVDIKLAEVNAVDPNNRILISPRIAPATSAFQFMKLLSPALIACKARRISHSLLPLVS